MGRGPSDSADEATLIGTTAQYSGVTVRFDSSVGGLLSELAAATATAVG
jgi:hypothetical protein